MGVLIGLGIITSCILIVWAGLKMLATAKKYDEDFNEVYELESHRKVKY